MRQDKWREKYYCDQGSGHEGVITGIIPPEHNAHVSDGDGPPAAGGVSAGTTGIAHSLAGQLLMKSIVSSICSFLKMGPLSDALFLDRKGVSQRLRSIITPPLIRDRLSHQLSARVPGQTIAFAFLPLTPPPTPTPGHHQKGGFFSVHAVMSRTT